MRTLLVLTTGALIVFLGAGCANTTTPVATSTTPTSTAAGYIPTPIVTSTQMIPQGWKVQAFGDIWSVAYPGVVQPTNDEPPVKTRTRFTTIDLGTAVAEVEEKSVPRRVMTIDQLLPGDVYRTVGCVPTSTELGLDISAISTTTKQGIGICLRTQSEAAAGNRYHTISATVIGIQFAYALDYVVHSVECSNFERPTEQCVPYDEARDTALFWRILDTLGRPR